jgi:primosomal replication protein N
LNRFELDGRLLATAGARHTPAGLPTLRLQVQHTSTQTEAERTRPLGVETELVAYGRVAQALLGVQLGAHLALAGFIDRKSARDPRLELHVTAFEVLAPATPDLMNKEQGNGVHQA